ncbi:hypothetical protein EMIT079MI2_550007 [Bacillus sp. IT-79MI2]
MNKRQHLIDVQPIKTKDVAMLQEIFNHSTPQITLKYIGINKEEKDNILDIFYI